MDTKAEMKPVEFIPEDEEFQVQHRKWIEECGPEYLEWVAKEDLLRAKELKHGSAKA